MPHVFIDFETRSLVDLRVSGLWKYASDPSTYPLMLAAGFLSDDSYAEMKTKGFTEFDRRLQWLEYKHGRTPPDWIFDITEDDDLTVHAHNANFEIAIWQRVLVERWGWPDIPISRWVDTMGKCSHANQPRALANAAAALGGRQKKDTKGKQLIQLLSGPRKYVKAKKDKDGRQRIDNIDYLKEKGTEFFLYGSDLVEPTHYWENDPHLLAAFARYNEQDIMAEAEVDSLVRPYTWREQDVWALDSVINQRGIPVDVELCEAAMELFDYEQVRAEVGLQNLTDGVITGPKQYARIAKWINERDPSFGPSCNKDRIASWLDETYDPRLKAHQEIKDLLDLKDILGGAAIMKYAAAFRQHEPDHRARGQLFYHSASTGRWAGSGIQVHNFFRASVPEEEAFDVIKRCDIDEVRRFCKKNGYRTVTDLLKNCVRGIIWAPEGKDLVVSDFAGIESRVLQWLAGAEDVLDIFRNGGDLYVYTAAGIFGLDYDDMMGPDGKVKDEHKEKRQIGKIAVLALGYGMGWVTYQRNCLSWGVEIEDQFANEIVQKWRDSNPLIADHTRGLWRRLDRATMAVVKNPKVVGKISNEQGVTFRVGCDRHRDNLWIELPSGRRLYYPQPHLSYGRMNDTDRGIKYCFRDKDDKPIYWDRPRLVYRDGSKGYTDTYGGKIAENVTQAVSRDLLVESIFQAEEKGLSVIAHVHDEIIVEAEEDDKSAFDRLHSAMSYVPDWASGLPIAAETYRSKRYTK